MSLHLRRWIALAMVPLMCGCQAAFFRVVNAGGASATAQTRVYAPQHDLKLDVYRPSQATTGAPVALFFYGGSWRSGSRDEYAFVGKALAASGILTMVADYRKYPQGRFPDFETDAAVATRWAIDHAREWGGDPARVFLIGHSAGAQIVALLATDARYLAAEGLRPSHLAGVVGIAGPYDFLPLTDPKIKEVFGADSTWPASQPVNFVDGDEPPFLLLNGSGDRVVDPHNSASLTQRLKAAGVGVVHKEYPRVGHFRILAAMRYPALSPTLADVADFIRHTPAAAEKARAPHTSDEP
ncbi:MAG: alpha/beta hydrolase [Dokdonella sp.]